MELVGPHQVLGALGDFPLLRREQFRGDGGVQNIPEDGGQRRVGALRLIGGVGGEVADQGLGDGAVDPVHGHVVAVVGGPAQGQLTQVPGADDQSSPLVGQVHQHLGPLPGLAVLKGDGQVVHGLADVPEVDPYRLADVHRAEVGADALGQKLGVGLGAAGGAKTGHGDRQNVRPGPAQQVHGPGGDEQGQGGVQPAGQPHHRAGGPGVLQPLFQPQGGDGENLLASLPPVSGLRRDKGVLPDGPGESGVRRLQLEGAAPIVLILLIGAEGVHLPALKGQLFQVDLADGQPGVKSLFGQDCSIFGDDVVPGKDQIGGGLPLAGVGVDIAAHQTARLPRRKSAAVGGLARQLIGGGQVQNQGGPRLDQTGGGGLRGPKVLADLHAHDQVRDTLAGEEPTGTHVHKLIAAQLEGGLLIPSGGEPAALIKLAVVGDIHLGPQSQDFPFANHRRAVIQLVVPFAAHRQADSGEHVQLLRLLQNTLQGVLRPAQEGILQKQVAAGVARDAQLGQGQHLHALFCRFLHQSDDLPRVVPAVCHLDFRRSRRHFDKAVPHKRASLVRFFYHIPNFPGLQENDAGGRFSAGRRTLFFLLSRLRPALLPDGPGRSLF